MNKSVKFLLLLIILSIVLSGCTSSSPTVVVHTPTNKIPTSTKVAPTSTNIPPTSTKKVPTATIERPTATPTVSSTESTSNVGSRHYEEDGGFSYIPPEGWEIYEIPGLKYHGLMDSNLSGSNVIFVDETYSDSLENYVDQSIEALRLYFPDFFEMISMDEIETDSGLHGTSVVTQNVVNDIEVYQTYFFFDLGEKILVITYTSMVKDTTSNIIKLGDLIKSIQIED